MDVFQAPGNLAGVLIFEEVKREPLSLAVYLPYGLHIKKQKQPAELTVFYTVFIT